MTELRSEAISIARQAEDVENETTGLDAAGAVTNFAALGSVQPIPSRKLMMLKESDRTRDPQMIYTEFALAEGDILTKVSNGKEYYVTGVRDWSQKSFAHYEAMGLLKDDA